MPQDVRMAEFAAFDNSYARLPERFFARLEPTPVSEPKLVKVNDGLARQLGIDPAVLTSPEGVQILSGNAVAPGSEPIAMAYAGHQFGGFQPQLGDGRAILLGEVVDRDGVRRDIQLKGSGPTPFSRNGDGRAALGPVLREYIVSEAFAALGIPSTRALAVVATGDIVVRESYLPGAILTRVAASHVRVGTFQYFAARGDMDGVRTLADYVIARHYPGAARETNPYRALFKGVVARQASLVAQWLGVGFIHGVMNTDNMQIAGETIDFGPCAFMDFYDPDQVYSSIDRGGRYRYAYQPRLALWNLARLAETLLPLFGETQGEIMAFAQGAIDEGTAVFHRAHEGILRRKLGLASERAGDFALAQQLLDLMAASKADFTSTFRALGDALESPVAAAALAATFADRASFDGWVAAWKARLGEEARTLDEAAAAMRAVNPAYIPRNHLVEEAIAAAVGHGDFGPFEALLAVTARPYESQPAHARYGRPPEPDQVVRQTFCGT